MEGYLGRGSYLFPSKVSKTGNSFVTPAGVRRQERPQRIEELGFGKRGHVVGVLDNDDSDVGHFPFQVLDSRLQRVVLAYDGEGRDLVGLELVPRHRQLLEPAGDGGER